MNFFRNPSTPEILVFSSFFILERASKPLFYLWMKFSEVAMMGDVRDQKE